MNPPTILSALWARLRAFFSPPAEPEGNAPAGAAAGREPQAVEPAIAPTAPEISEYPRPPEPEPEREVKAAPAAEPARQPELATVAAAAASPVEFEPAPAPAAVVSRPDPQREALEAKRASLEDQVATLAARRAEMAECLQDFELHQYRALGEVLGECLRLRHLCRRLEAEDSGSAADRAAAAEAGAEFDAYENAHAEVAAGPVLDEVQQEELKRLYRAAAMSCHPDRVEEGQREAAHALFVRIQQAYRRSDLEALQSLKMEIAQGLRGVRPAASGTGSEGLKQLIARLQIQAADLILAIQTLQLDAGYRRAARPEEWEPYFDSARRQFEAEIVSLKIRIRVLGGAC